MKPSTTGNGKPLRSSGSPAGSFPETRWSLVRRAVAAGEPGAEEALNELCQDYWYPLYVFVRAQGARHEDACDEIQGFFTALLKGNSLATADPARGRLRTFLLTGLTRYRAKLTRARRTNKRGGREEHVSVDADWGRLRFETELTQNLSPELSLDRAWARLLVDQSLQALAANYARGGKADEFAVLSEFLEPGTAARLYADAAAQLGISENNLKVRVHRMRGKFRRILEQRVRETMGPETDELQDEVRHLIRVLE